mgnify:CR=1 FL=1
MYDVTIFEPSCLLVSLKKWSKLHIILESEVHISVYSWNVVYLIFEFPISYLANIPDCSLLFFEILKCLCAIRLFLDNPYLVYETR